MPDYNAHLIVGRKTVDNNRNGQGENKDLQIIESKGESYGQAPSSLNMGLNLDKITNKDRVDSMSKVSSNDQISHILSEEGQS